MGSSLSTQAPARHSSVEKRPYRLSSPSSSTWTLVEPSTELKITTTQKWEDKLLSDPKNQLALNVLTSSAATSVLQNPAALITDLHIFSDKIELEGAPVTNQRSSGRCWLFASTNVFRVGLIKKYKLQNFELSQAYLFFWDKLEKANFFLEQIIDTLDEPLDGRLVQHLLSSPVGDGGQWDMVVNLVEKYGLVPQTLYPDSFNAKASSRVNWLITAKLREAALKLRSISPTDSEKQPVDELQRYKSKIMQEIYGVLVLAFGVPPKPEEEFKWDYADKDGKHHCVKTSPRNFYRENMGAVSFSGLKNYSEKGGVGERFSLVNDPRNAYLRLLTVERLGNIVGGRGIKYVNVDMKTMKSAVITMIKAQRPVFFGCDVGKFSDSSKGIMDTALFDYDLGFNIKLGMDKASRLRAGESSMTHAMVLSGVHIEDGEPVRWRVENSWGETAGQKGYFVMSDQWMDEYCYQVVVDPAFVSKEVLEVLKQLPKVLPLWDPMGSLA